MKLLNELLNLSEAANNAGRWGGSFNEANTLVGMTINDRKITDKTKDEIWVGSFYCDSSPNLKSLEGAPKEVTRSATAAGNFNCSNCRNLTSLKGAPEKIAGYFLCIRNDNLASLEGAPKEVGKDFYCSNNRKITSLKGIHKQVTSMNGVFEADFTSIKSHVLGLLLIKGCTSVMLDNKEVQNILNKYLPNTRGNKAVIECQSDLLDADLDDFAEL